MDVSFFEQNRNRTMREQLRKAQDDLDAKMGKRFMVLCFMLVISLLSFFVVSIHDLNANPFANNLITEFRFKFLPIVAIAVGFSVILIGDEFNRNGKQDEY